MVKGPEMMKEMRKKRELRMILYNNKLSATQQKVALQQACQKGLAAAIAAETGARETGESIARELSRLRQEVEKAGGRGTELDDTIRAAAEYRNTPTAERRHMSHNAWKAYNGVIAHNIPRPGWDAGGGRGETARVRAEKQLAKVIADSATQIARAVSTEGEIWAKTTGEETRRRERSEEGRQLLRTIIRGWREVTDGIQAGAAKREQDWKGGRGEAGEGGRLGKRLIFKNGGKWSREEMWGARVMLTWMRTVRAYGVMRQRSQLRQKEAKEQETKKRQGEKREREEVETRRTYNYNIHQFRLTEEGGRETVREAEITTGVTLPKEKEKAALMEKIGVTSGAAAIMARRQGAKSQETAKREPAKKDTTEKRTDGSLRYRQANFKAFESATAGQLAQTEHRKRKRR